MIGHNRKRKDGRQQDEDDDDEDAAGVPRSGLSFCGVMLSVPEFAGSRMFHLFPTKLFISVIF